MTEETPAPRPRTLRDYVQHKFTCSRVSYEAADGLRKQLEPYVDTGKLPCTCGLDDLLAFPEAGTGWEPISTAPKEHDGLLLSDGVRASQGGWLSELDQGAEYEGQGIVSAGWWSVDGIETPTLWMRMPLPPAPDRTKE